MIPDASAGEPTLARIPQILDRVEVITGMDDRFSVDIQKIEFETVERSGLGRTASIVSVEGDKARAPDAGKPGAVEWIPRRLQT